MIVEQIINVYFDEICIMELMKHFERLLLLILALVVGGGLVISYCLILSQ